MTPAKGSILNIIEKERKCVPERVRFSVNRWRNEHNSETSPEKKSIPGIGIKIFIAAL